MAEIKDAIKLPVRYDEEYAVDLKKLRENAIRVAEQIKGLRREQFTDHPQHWKAIQTCDELAGDVMALTLMLEAERSSPWVPIDRDAIVKAADWWLVDNEITLSAGAADLDRAEKLADFILAKFEEWKCS